MKKRWLLLLLGGILGVVGAASYLIITKPKPSVVTPGETSPNTTATPKNISWNDPAGFTFEYPEGLTLDKHDEDRQNYAHLEFTHPDQPGRLIIWGKDLPAGVSDAASWVKLEKRFAAGAVFDTTLGGLPAKKVLLTGSPAELFIGTVESDVLFYLESQLDPDNFWNTVVDVVTRSFTFKTPQEATSGGGEFSEEEAVDEEIVVE